MIKVQNLAKVFGTKRAVDGVSFSVERGEVLGFLGPNGAGKSTTMRMITGFIPPTAGTVTVGGFDMVENPIPAKRLIGYLPENAPAYTDMTVHGFLSFAAEIRGLARRRQEEGGQSRGGNVLPGIACCTRAWKRFPRAIAIAPVSRNPSFTIPDVLVLDEPTDGLDPNQKHEVRSLIRRMGEKKAIIFSTHILEEVDAVCSRAIIIDRGKIVANGTPQELRRKSEWAGAVTLRVQRRGRRRRSRQRCTSCRRVKRATVVRRRADGRHGRACFPKAERERRIGPRRVAKRRTAGRSRNCTRKKAGWTKCSAASRCRTRRRRRRR